RLLEDRLARLVDAAVFAELGRADAAVEERVRRAVALPLDLPRAEDLLAHARGRAAVLLAAKLPVWHRRHLDVDVDPVDQRPADAREVLLDLRLRTLALAAGIGVVPARTRIHRGNQHEPRRKHDRRVRSGDRDDAVFKRLAEGLQYRAGELGELIEKQKPMVRERHLARL